jgi:DNA ligase-1
MLNRAEHDMETTITTGLSRRHLLARASLGLGGLTGFGGALAAARPQAAALLLARDAPVDIDPAAYLVSEKFDGARALWDGRSMRFRSGHTVPAPAWFTARLPAQALDGELWLARGQFERLCAAVRRHLPIDDEWRQISYRIFELPNAQGGFAARAERIRTLVAQVGWSPMVAVDQWIVDGRPALRRRLDEVVRAGGEGLVLHRADAPYQTGRSGVLLKLKPLQDADAMVIGHLAGRGKYAGQLGALQVRGEGGATFLIGTGFDDALRAVPPPLGSTVTYTHRGVTANGIPRFASFLRVRGDL